MSRTGAVANQVSNHMIADDIMPGSFRFLFCDIYIACNLTPGQSLGHLYTSQYCNAVNYVGGARTSQAGWELDAQLDCKRRRLGTDTKRSALCHRQLLPPA
jgi:hypothetical protein